MMMPIMIVVSVVGDGDDDHVVVDGADADDHVLY